jgi:hypothetical protein
VPNLYQDNCKYTPLQAGTQTNTATFTVNPGPALGPGGQLLTPVPPVSPSVFYGVSVQGLGTNTTTGTGTGGASQVVNVYDVIAPTGLGSNTATVTNLLANGTATAAGAFICGSGLIGWPGIRYNGALVVEISGALTLGSANCLWD